MTGTDHPSNIQLGALTGELGFMLRMAQLVAFDQFFRALPDSDLRPGEFSVLWVIGLNPGIRQGDLAQALHIKRAHMTKLIQRLSARNLVHRAPSPDDRRAVLLTLTDTGSARIETQRDAFFLRHAPDITGLTRAEHDHLLALLARFTGLNSPQT